MRAALAMPMAVELMLALALAAALSACWAPTDQRPGLRLRGAVVDLPEDWSFTDQYGEIAIEVRTPYWLRHSVTIWCASSGDELYVGARSPETKKWPGWVERNPNVRLLIGDKIYEARLTQVADDEQLARIRRAYVAKYDLPDPPPPKSPPLRYWLVVPRET